MSPAMAAVCALGWAIAIVALFRWWRWRSRALRWAKMAETVLMKYDPATFRLYRQRMLATGQRPFIEPDAPPASPPR